MHMLNMFKTSALISLLTVATLLLVSFLLSQSSILILGCFFFLLSHFLVRYIDRSLSKVQSHLVFSLFFLVYFNYAFLTDYIFVQNPDVDYFAALDSRYFYLYSEFLGTMNGASAVISHALSDYRCSDWKGFAILTGLISLASNAIDFNSTLVQKIPIVTASALILVFLLTILRQYTENNSALYATILYGLFSYSLFYSAILLRDVYIGLFMIFMFWLFYQNMNFYTVIFLLAVSIAVTFLFRTEHGVFTLIVPATYVFYYSRKSNNRYRFLIALPIIAVGIWAFAGRIAAIQDQLLDTSDRYLSHSIEQADESSIGAKLLKLPYGTGYLAAGLFSQTLPFPFFISTEREGIWGLPKGVGAIFWFLVWVFLIKAVMSTRFRSQMDARLVLLSVISLLLIFGTAYHIDVRRVMAVYPMLFVVAVTQVTTLTSTEFKLWTSFGVFAYTLALVAYFIVKG